ncbi:MAG: hypothetical protein D6788_07470 [Planctomycetota bacterium]|nr:MAG: hypothetical protein D6788_07470 [Planctomycetota bacterium]
MTATLPNADRSTPDRKNVSIRELLTRLEALFDQAADARFDAALTERIRTELQALHVALRRSRAARRIGGVTELQPLPPEYADERQRLDEEYPRFLGMVDRLVRASHTVCDQALEDHDVFMLRGRELIASLRRHEAEEDRLFFLSAWQDTGGESG